MGPFPLIFPTQTDIFWEYRRCQNGTFSKVETYQVPYIRHEHTYNAHCTPTVRTSSVFKLYFGPHTLPELHPWTYQTSNVNVFIVLMFIFFTFPRIYMEVVSPNAFFPAMLIACLLTHVVCSLDFLKEESKGQIRL